MKITDFKKSQAEVYKLRFDNLAYADITLDEISDYAGRISISCDWGNWSYFWGSMGSPFKKFLCSLDNYYLGSKFGIPYVINEEATKAGFYELIKELRRDKNLTASEAKEMCDDISRDISFDDADNIARFDCDSYAILSEKIPYFTPHEYIEKKRDPSFNEFYDNVWSEFVKILEQEQV